MSETPTPRTDEAEFTYEDYDSHDTVVCVKVVPIAIARQLERDLASAESERIEWVKRAERAEELLDRTEEALKIRTIERDDALVAADFANLACERKEAARKEAVALAARLRADLETEQGVADKLAGEIIEIEATGQATEI